MKGKSKTLSKPRMNRVGSQRIKRGQKSYDEVVFLRTDKSKPDEERKQAEEKGGMSEEDVSKKDDGSNDPIVFCLFLAGFVLFNILYLNYYYERRCNYATPYAGSIIIAG